MTVNDAPLTPLTLLRRSAQVFPDRTATVYEGQRVNYREFHGRVCRLANGLRRDGLTPGGRVAVLAPNVPMVLEAHFGVPLAGGVLVAINTRLNGAEIAYILEHSGSEVLIVDLIQPLIVRFRSGTGDGRFSQHLPLLALVVPNQIDSLTIGHP